MGRKERVKATWKVIKAYNDKGVEPEPITITRKLAAKFGLRPETIKDYIKDLKRGVLFGNKIYKVGGRYKLKAFKKTPE